MIIRRWDRGRCIELFKRICPVLLPTTYRLSCQHSGHEDYVYDSIPLYDYNNDYLTSAAGSTSLHSRHNQRKKWRAHPHRPDRQTPSSSSSSSFLRQCILGFSCVLLWLIVSLCSLGLDYIVLFPRSCLVPLLRHQ